MAMNPSTPQQQYRTTGGASLANMNWRPTLQREQRQELISKIYNELIRATGEAPGPTVWMKASNYELKLFHESQDRESYLTKISRRLYLLSQRPTMMNPFLQQMRQIQQQNMSMMPQGAAAPSANGTYPASAGYSAPPTSVGMMYSGMSPTMTLPEETSCTSEEDVYWTKHAELKSKYWNNCITVYQSFRRYVDLGETDDESSQKLRNLLHYVQQVVTFLGEERGKVPAKPLREISKAEQYIQRIVLPYVNKLNTEKTKPNGSPQETTSTSSQNSFSGNAATPIPENITAPMSSETDDFTLHFGQEGSTITSSTSSGLMPPASPFDLNMGLTSPVGGLSSTAPVRQEQEDDDSGDSFGLGVNDILV